VGWLGIARSKLYNWRERYGKANEHGGKIPRDHWLEAWEKQAILDYYDEHPFEGYRRLAFMMLDEQHVCASPSTVYRVLKAGNRLGNRPTKNARKGKGFVQPKGAHRHWHVDIAYVNIAGTFFYLCSVLDGYSRYIVHWELRKSMKDADVQIIIERARERFPSVNPRIISDNGPQFIAKDFKSYIRLVGMTHVKTSPYYPQSNGKIERYHRTIKRTTIRPNAPRTFEQGRRLVERFVKHYNERRLHSGIGYVTPFDKLQGLEKQIWQERDQRLEAARAARALRRKHIRLAFAQGQPSKNKLKPSSFSKSKTTTSAHPMA
jgi:transposase InsO family protein